jgi:hypothetical protein
LRETQQYCAVAPIVGSREELDPTYVATLRSASGIHAQPLPHAFGGHDAPDDEFGAHEDERARARSSAPERASLPDVSEPFPANFGERAAHFDLIDPDI